MGNEIERSQLVGGADGAEDLFVERVELTPAQVRDLHQTPIELVEAPGEGKVLRFEFATIFLDYDSASYADVAAGDDASIAYRVAAAAGTVVANIETSAWLGAGADQVVEVPRNAGLIEPEVNQPLALKMSGDGVTGGDSPVHVIVAYRVVDLVLDE